MKRCNGCRECPLPVEAGLSLALVCPAETQPLLVEGGLDSANLGRWLPALMGGTVPRKAEPNEQGMFPALTWK